tara:strand:- start:85 stop:678 length:594 start_codon:yes stop_codon:yes gene_type:complete
MSLYCTYALLKVLKDKCFQKMLNYYNGNSSNVVRLDPTINHNIYDNLRLLMTKPTHVIDNIYIGNSLNASNYYELMENGITHVINVSEEISNYFPDEIEYLRIPVNDTNDASLENYYGEALEFINNLDVKDNNILIHCFMGSSRSATIVVLYLMKIKSMSFDAAYKYLKDIRPVVNMNVTFAEELQDVEKNMKETWI